MDVPFHCGWPLSGGEGVEPLRLRLQGLNLPSIPAGVGHPSLHCTFGDGENVIYIHFSLMFVRVSGSHHII
jgi:hypothetical protein